MFCPHKPLFLPEFEKKVFWLTAELYLEVANLCVCKFCERIIYIVLYASEQSIQNKFDTGIVDV